MSSCSQSPKSPRVTHVSLHVATPRRIHAARDGMACCPATAWLQVSYLQHHIWLDMSTQRHHKAWWHADTDNAEPASRPESNQYVPWYGSSVAASHSPRPGPILRQTSKATTRTARPEHHMAWILAEKSGAVVHTNRPTFHRSRARSGALGRCAERKYAAPPTTRRLAQ